jgi:hypothetical protein
MNVSFRIGLSLVAILASLSAFAQQPVHQQNSSQPSPSVVSVSAKTTTARVAAPDELVNVNGKVMRVAEVVAILSSSTLSEPHPRNLEKQNSSGAPQSRPESQTHSN